ncbi:hypothetical protein GE061_010177 [Apolygus lucorum]|uniref:Uncharacterized protein n=1 Tax=Apolygus lucorum TaxID=248454 RepID=A0A8S9Y6G5_APOLU|nr:hypothetical protein GE061_010177 [Apolygus lucorum]
MIWRKSSEQNCHGRGRRDSPAKIRVFALFKLMVLAVFLLFIGFWILLHFASDIFHRPDPCQRSWPLQEYVVMTTGCRILNMAPHELDLLPFFSLDANPAPIVCEGSDRGELVKSTTTHLYLDMEVAKNYTKNDFHCCYKPFRRLTASYNASGEYDQFIDYMNVYLDYCIPILFNNHTLITFQFVYVVCKDAIQEMQSTNQTLAFYEDYFTFAVDKETENEAFEKLTGTQLVDSEPDKSSEEAFERDNSEEDFDPTLGNPYSVLILGFDGMSRMNFIRQMPRTMAFFEENSGTTLLGFNKVGYNTFPNLIPALTGMSTKELEQECWPNNRSIFDHCPFIWKKFKEHGYVTAYGEDNTFVSTFSYQTIGFRSEPVDYYLKPFFVENEVNLHVTKLEPHTSILCVGNKPNMVRFENAVRSFVINMKNRPSFGLFWFNGVSHDYLNLPRIGDSLFRGMLDKLKDEGALKTTVLIGLSDHGIRWGDFRQTFQGFLEERLPLATIVLPERFKAKYPKDVESLKLNSHRLSSHFDIHKTLLDILYRYETITDDYTDEPSQLYFKRTLKLKGHGISLFTEIPENRTCSSAGIPTEWCACSTLQVVSTNKTFAKRLASIALKSINKLLRNATQCELLTLEKVTTVWEDIPATLDVRSQYLFNDYVVNFVTSPGKGRFEARLRVRGSIDRKMKPKSIIKLIGFISRLNMYKDDSYCVDEPSLKLYCYCSPGSKRTNVITEIPSEFTDVVHLDSSVAARKWPTLQNKFLSKYSLTDLATIPEAVSKRRKLKKLLKIRTIYEIAKIQGRNRTDKNVSSTLLWFKDIKSIRQVQELRDQTSTTIPSTTTSLVVETSTRLEEELINISDSFQQAPTHEDKNLDFAATDSNIRQLTDPDQDEKLSLEGLDNNYRT